VLGIRKLTPAGKIPTLGLFGRQTFPRTNWSSPYLHLLGSSLPEIQRELHSPIARKLWSEGVRTDVNSNTATRSVSPDNPYAPDNYGLKNELDMARHRVVRSAEGGECDVQAEGK
jgi:hypothetical protein